MLIEINIDALVGPTHNFGGLGVGNVASITHHHQTSSPQQAALEGLRKASLIADLGVPQFLWLPPQRPVPGWLQSLGFEGDLHHRIEQAYYEAPQVLSAAFSSAFMWAANSATVTPATDAANHRYHVTLSNLASSWHRSPEARDRAVDFRRFFTSDIPADIHEPLPSIVPLRDEGAANHMRLCDSVGASAVHIFVDGDDGTDAHSERPRFFPRQTRAASQAIARRHKLDPQFTFFLSQHPQAISAGVFHNDVIATSHQHLLLHHEFAFLEAEPELEKLNSVFTQRTGRPLLRIEISETELPLSEAVRSYFFNSQIVTPTIDGQDSPRMALVCPQQCQKIESASRLIERLIADDAVPIEQVHFVDLTQSMAGGGGPACLRLRMPVAREHVGGLNSELRLDHRLRDRLTAAIERLYPQSWRPDDFLNRDLVEAVLRVPEELRAAIQPE